MRKLFLGAAFFLSLHAGAQTLFTYGDDSVSVHEFLRAFNKNNAGDKSTKAMKEYLDLYIASRLKIKEAKQRGYDTLPQLISEINNLRTQIIPMYEQDQESLNTLTAEAFVRAQKDVRLAHIFISFIGENGLKDTAAAEKKAQEAYALLKKGSPFTEIARKYSDDPSVKQNGGELGYITVFSLPYELENIAYSTPVHQFSAPFRSRAGYHIFKNLGERKAVGRIKAAQILLAFPPDADASHQARLKKLADSIYSRLQKGDDFGKLAATFSNDIVSAASDGLIPEFGVGQYEDAFEKVIYGLKDGAVSKPFATAHGFHIVKRIAITPVSAKKDEKTLAALKEKVEQSDRIELAKKTLAEKVLKQAGYQKLDVNDQQLWAYTDSLFDSKPLRIKVELNERTPLFTLGKKNGVVSDWIAYAQVFRYKADGSGVKPYHELWNEFIRASALDYYKNNLEDFNEQFRNQMTEFKEGNLFFEIMQRDIWGPAQADTMALQAFYKENQQKYIWNKSADAVIFYTGDTQTAQLLASQVKKTPWKWKELVASMNDKVTADSARFEWTQIPHAAKTVPTNGMVTTPVVNAADQTASFAYIVNVYTKPAWRSFEEAKGMVINDYQAALENKWIAELKKKYPVKINNAALSALMGTVKK